jgi:nickel-dependent lactate racemase
MKVDIHYGNGLISLEVPKANVAHIIRPWQDEEETDNSAILQKAMSCPQIETFQDAIAGKHLCVLLDDGTRDEPFKDIFEQLFTVLRTCSFVRFLICTGTHEPATPQNARIRAEIENAAVKACIDNFEVRAHDREKAEFIEAGVTSRGTEIIYNALADDADVFLAFSDIKVHYFAGYSNPIKNFVPGICAFRTAEQNHSMALDEKSTFGIHPWHSDANRRNNPLACDQLEGLRLIVKERPVFAFATITTSGQICWAKFGHIESVAAEAFGIVDQRNTHTINPVGRLIVSPGGMPNDIDLYIAQRALELTKSSVTDGGDILFLAACPNGVGEEKTMENFYNRLILPIDDIFDSIESEYKLYSHKPYKFARLIRRLRQIHVYSQIPDEIIRAAHLFPAHDPQKIVDDWLTEEPNDKITIVDGANKIALYSASNSVSNL